MAPKEIILGLTKSISQTRNRIGLALIVGVLWISPYIWFIVPHRMYYIKWVITRNQQPNIAKQFQSLPTAHRAESKNLADQASTYNFIQTIHELQLSYTKHIAKGSNLDLRFTKFCLQGSLQ
ncbi:hypothetical protein OCU04_010015 [Sclerotinia nivalis]|uniref:Uncharacterized protein n=1 Tax=Sclerotinia nivalis TaxID=352851 RepID=A0A9X0ADP9_9HELO|nr:hypothetical protein OCU04_010015 [Sclerotinia nivalis]